MTDRAVGGLFFIGCGVGVCKGEADFHRPVNPVPGWSPQVLCSRLTGWCSAPQVAPRPHSFANSYELFEVSEERDEEVAAFCHMLDV